MTKAARPHNTDRIIGTGRENAMARQDLKARHKELIKEGVYYHLALRWADGGVQHFHLPTLDAYEVVKWARAYDNFCRMAYVRDLRTGRFCRV